jgi:hypothetical protein
LHPRADTAKQQSTDGQYKRINPHRSKRLRLQG